MNTHSSSAAVPSSHRALSASLPSRQRARRTNDCLADADLNTARGRRVADLARAYLAALGHPCDIGRQAAVVAAAELQVLAEEARQVALASPQTPDLDGLVRVQGAADRALRRLGIRPGEAPKRSLLRALAEAAT